MSRAVSLVPLALIAALAPMHAALAQQAVAATAPGAADVLRDLPPPPGTPMPALSAPEPAAAVPAQVAAPPVSFVLRAFEAKGATALSPYRMTVLTDPYIGKPMSDKELGDLIAAMRQAYEQQGMGLVSVGFPTQDVSTGTLSIEVIEPRLGRVQVAEGPDAPVTARRVEGLLSFFKLKAGGLLHTQSLERVMFALNDMPGVQAKATLAPAGDEGVYNLSIQTQARRAWDASLAIDNQGIGDAGRWRLTGVARLNNPLGLGDNLDVQALLSSNAGVKVGRVAYELPVAYTPARLSVAYAKVAYALGGQFEALDATGTARVLEANLSYPLIRSRSRTLMARLGAESKAMTDKMGVDDSRGDKRIQSVVAGLNLETRDTFLGGGFNGASVQLNWGRLRWGSQLQQQLDEARGDDLRTGGRFARAQWQYSRLQYLSRALSLYANVGQQLASRNLDAAEKISLGGPRGVRAYAAAEGASDQATTLTTELRYWINPNWSTFALYDWAQGWRARRADPLSETANELYLRGAGLGLSVSYPQWFTVKASVAWRGRQLPQTDPGHSKARLYVQAQHSF